MNLPQRSGSTKSDDEIQGPAIISPTHVQDRELSTVAGAKKGFRRLDGLAWLAGRKEIHSHQFEAGRRLQDDYEKSQMQAGARSNGGRVNGSRTFDIPDHAIDAKDRVNDALAVLPPELLTLTVLFLLPTRTDEDEPAFGLEKIAARVREDKRAISLGVRASLSLLARHYGN